MDCLRQQKQSDVAVVEVVRTNHNMELLSQLTCIQQSLREIQDSLIPRPLQLSPNHHNSNDPNIDVKNLDKSSAHLTLILQKLDGILDQIHTSTEMTVMDEEVEDGNHSHHHHHHHNHDTVPIPDVRNDIESIHDPHHHEQQQQQQPMIHHPLEDSVTGAVTPMPPITTASTKMALREAMTILVLQRPVTSSSSSSSPGQSDAFRAGIQSLYLFTKNIAKQPHIPRYRKIYCDNDNYRNNIKDLVGATEFLSAIGFVPNESIISLSTTTTARRNRISNYWEWVPIHSPHWDRMVTSSNRKDMEIIYLERLREAVVALETIQAAAHDMDNHVLLQQTLVAAQLTDDSHGNTTPNTNDKDSTMGVNVAMTTADVSADKSVQELMESS
jgi:hypothetical protein